VKNLKSLGSLSKAISFLFTCALMPLNAQDARTVQSPLNTQEFIADFKSSALLVRLQDKSQTIAILIDKGLTKPAKQLRQEQRLQNREILLSFSQTFDFCPVYYFYSKDSEAVRNGDLEGIIFDENLNIVTKDLPKYYTAEFAETAELGIDGLIIMNQKLLSFDNNLPFFERRYVFFNLTERSKAEMVAAYNKRLQGYHQFYQSKKSP
jgi:hypothetical protein